MRTTAWITTLACGAVLLHAGQATAQKASQKGEEPGPAARRLLEEQSLAEGRIVRFISSEVSFDGRIVKGAPYQAQTVSEHVQTLSDGNRIYRKQTTAAYRDSEGRTRRDQTITAIGTLTADSDGSQMVFINDPVGGFNYALDVQNRTVRRMAEHSFTRRPAVSEHSSSSSHTPDRFISRLGGTSSVRKESLGKQVIEGIEAEGSRSVLTIPAGEIGNERPIEVVEERWYSPELQIVVMSRHSDPRVGEDTYRVTNVKRAEPDPSLFQIPSDYTVAEGRGMEEAKARAWSGKKPGSKQ